MAAELQRANPDGYVHSRDANEYQRLREQALLWQRASEEVLDRIGLVPGMSCLDVGATVSDHGAASPVSKSMARSASKRCRTLMRKAARSSTSWLQMSQA